MPKFTQEELRRIIEATNDYEIERSEVIKSTNSKDVLSSFVGWLAINRVFPISEEVTSTRFEKAVLCHHGNKFSCMNCISEAMEGVKRG